MINKRFLVPVLALVGLALPAGASIVTYCSGSFCSPETNAQFTTDLASDSYTLQGLTTFSAVDLAGGIYTDPTTGIEFSDFLVGNPISVSGSNLVAPSILASQNYIEIAIPATIVAVEFTVDVPQGVCLDAYCPAGETTGFVGFINTSPGSAWNVEIGPLAGGNFVEINNFNAATSNLDASPTPEVATFILIGSGLIAMRWMRRLPRRFFRTPQPA